MTLRAFISVRIVFRAASPISGLRSLMAYYLPVAIWIPSLVLEKVPEPRVCWMQYLPKSLVQLYYSIFRETSSVMVMVDCLPIRELGSIVGLVFWFTIKDSCYGSIFVLINYNLSGNYSF
jgi:hypothetical protein